MRNEIGLPDTNVDTSTTRSLKKGTLPPSCNTHLYSYASECMRVSLVVYLSRFSPGRRNSCVPPANLGRKNDDRQASRSQKPGRRRRDPRRVFRQGKMRLSVSPLPSPDSLLKTIFDAPNRTPTPVPILNDMHACVVRDVAASIHFTQSLKYRNRFEHAS